MYAYLNQGEWVSSLVNFQEKRDSVVGGRPGNKRKRHMANIDQTHKRSLSESDLEKETLTKF